MKFFVPTTKDDKQAEELYASIKKFAQEAMGSGIGSQRIFALTCFKKGKEYQVEVGKPDPATGETVMAILEFFTYLVCTPNRGVLRGWPVLYRKEEVLFVTYFESDNERSEIQ